MHTMSTYQNQNMEKMVSMRNYLKLVMKVAKDSVTTSSGLYQMATVHKH